MIVVENGATLDLSKNRLNFSGNVTANNTFMLSMSLRTLGGPGGMGQQ